MNHLQHIKLICLLLACLICISAFTSLAASSDTEREYAPPSNWDSYPYVNLTLSTPLGLTVPCRQYTTDFSETEAEYIESLDTEYFFDYYDYQFRRIAPASRKYNCYSYAFYSRNNTTNSYVIMQPTGCVSTEGTPLYAYWQDAHFENTPKSPGEAEVGDVILYYSCVSQMTVCHAGVVSQVSGGNPTKVISKWGLSALYEHGVYEVPRSYAVTSGTAHYGEVYYEVYSYAINHDYGNWTSISSTKHRGTCSVTNCTSTKTADHSLATTGTYNASTHQLKCPKCDYSTNTSHSYMYSYTGSSSTHIASCACGYSKNQSHSLNWTSVSDTRHRCYCSKCEYSVTSNHAFGSWISEGTSGHSHTCSACSKKITQAHVFSGTECIVCGYNGPGTAAFLLNALLPQGCKFE